MTESWSDGTAAALVQTFAGAIDGAGVVIAAAAIDGPDTVAQLHPDATPDDAVFEIGSISKPVTATLVALLVGEGKLALADQIGRWIDAGPNADITVEQLATHTAGLKKLAPNALDGHDRDNPYAHYTVELAEQGLRSVRREESATPRYSNFGYQLLGLIVERASGMSYGEFLQDALLEPLSMTNTGVRGKVPGGRRLDGHSGGRTVPHWDQHLPGNGGVESTIGDLAKFARACIDPPDSALGRAIRETQIPRVPRNERSQQGLGWVLPDGGLVWHNGGTGGFASSLLMHPGRQRAVAVLVNSHDASGDLDRAVSLAMRGEDPRVARPQPPGPEWSERATSLVAALLEQRFADVHALLAPNFGKKLTVEQLGSAWAETIAGRGTPGDLETDMRRSGPNVVTDSAVGFSERPLRVAAAWSGDRVNGLMLLEPGEPLPW